MARGSPIGGVVLVARGRIRQRAALPPPRSGRRSVAIFVVGSFLMHGRGCLAEQPNSATATSTNSSGPTRTSYSDECNMVPDPFVCPSQPLAISHVPSSPSSRCTPGCTGNQETASGRTAEPVAAFIASLAPERCRRFGTLLFGTTWRVEPRGEPDQVIVVHNCASQ